MTEIITADLSKFGYRELDIAAELLRQYTNNPQILAGDGVCLSFNTSSGYVFLTDSDYNVALLNGEKLERFYTCINCGREGFAEEFKEHQDKLQCPACEGDNGMIYR